MKVLHVYKTYFPDTVGGVEQSINQIACGTANLGVIPEILTISPSAVDRTIQVDGHRVHRCRSNFEVASTPFSASAFLRFRQLASKSDLIHFHFPYPFADILHFTSQIKKPTIITYHSDIIKQRHLLKIYRPLQECFLNSVVHIVATSPNYQASSHVLSRVTHKTSIIPLGLDKHSYPEVSPEKLSFWKKRFGPRFFLFIGVIRYYKGLHVLVEAARNSAYPVVILGAGPIEAKLKAHALKLGIQNMHFLGFQPDEDKVALLELCSAIVFPSHLRSEAFGVSLLEGAAYGKPLISCEIGTGTTYVNIDKETGIVVPPSEPAALRQAMDYLWNNPEEAKTMGQRAEARYCKLFTTGKMARSYLALYKKLLDRC